MEYCQIDSPIIYGAKEIKKIIFTKLIIFTGLILVIGRSHADTDTIIYDLLVSPYRDGAPVTVIGLDSCFGLI